MVDVTVLSTIFKSNNLLFKLMQVFGSNRLNTFPFLDTTCISLDIFSYFSADSLPMENCFEVDFSHNPMGIVTREQDNIRNFSLYSNASQRPGFGPAVGDNIRKENLIEVMRHLLRRLLPESITKIVYDGFNKLKRC